MKSLLQKLTRGNALLLIFILGMGGTFQGGYHATGLSSPSPFIQAFINSSWHDRYKEPPHPQTVTMIWSLIVSLYAVGGLCGAVCVKLISGLLGRKKGVIFSSCISIIAAVIMMTSKTAKSYEMIIVSRILFGYASGLGMSFHLIYLMEISPKKLRGRITVTSANSTILGKLFGQIFGLSEILGREELWDVLLCVPVCFSVLQVLAMPFLPETPRYLFIEKKDEKACRKALQSLWGPGDYKQEMDEMLIEQAAIEATPRKSPLQLLMDKNVRWQLLTMSLIYWFNQLSGISAINTFSYDILLEVGLPEGNIRYFTLGLGVCQLIVSMFAGLLMERFGRRPLFWGPYAAMSCVWVLVTITLNVKGSNSWTPYVSAALIILIIVFFNGGPGSVAGTLNTEVFIQSDRMAAFAIVGLNRWLAMAVVGLVFPFLIGSFGSYSFLFFACICVLGCFYIFFILPETKGKTVLEISEEFKAIRVCGKPFAEEKTMETKL